MARSIADVSRIEARAHEMETRAHAKRGLDPDASMAVSRAYRELAAAYRSDRALRELGGSSERKAKDWQDRAELERATLKDRAESEMRGDRRRRPRPSTARADFLPWFAGSKAKGRVRAVQEEQLLSEADAMYRVFRKPVPGHPTVGRQGVRRILRGFLGDDLFRVWLRTRGATLARE